MRQTISQAVTITTSIIVQVLCKHNFKHKDKDNHNYNHNKHYICILWNVFWAKNGGGNEEYGP